jgi:hypothetical protein
MLNEEKFFHDPTLRRNFPHSKTKISSFLKKYPISRISELPIAGAMKEITSSRSEETHPPTFLYNRCQEIYVL